MSTELTINNLLPVLTTGKLSEKNATILNTTFVGIDFGTSTTVVSIAVLGKNKEPLIVKPIELNQKLSDGAIFSSYKVPSVIAWYLQPTSSPSSILNECQRFFPCLNLNFS